MTPDLDISALFAVFYNRLPNILLYIIGIIYASMALRRHPKPSRYVILGLGILLLHNIGSGLFFSPLAVELRSSGVVELVNWALRLMFLAGIAVLVVAAFTDRPAKQRG